MYYYYPKYHCSKITQWQKSDIPANLRPFVDYQFSSGGYAGDDFKSFDRKYKNAVKKLLPEGWEIHEWRRNHYESSAVLKTPDGRFVYLHYSDVRYWQNEWMTCILIRTMKHEKDWTGGTNNHTDLVNLTEDLQRLVA